MYRIVHFTIDFLLKGGVQRWIDLFAKYTKDTFRHYVLTPNRLQHYSYENCIVPSFRHIQDNLKKYWNENFIPSTSHYITSEIIEYTRKLSPEIIIIYGNDAKELFIPAKLFSDKSLIISRCQHDMGLPPKEFIKKYLEANKNNLAKKYSLTMNPSRIDNIASYYSKNIMDIESVIKKIKSYYDEIKKIELYFFKNNDINIVLEEDAIDFIIEQLVNSVYTLADFYKKLSLDFKQGLELIRDKTGSARHFISKKALLNPETYISEYIKRELKNKQGDV